MSLVDILVAHYHHHPEDVVILNVAVGSLMNEAGFSPDNVFICQDYDAEVYLYAGKNLRYDNGASGWNNEYVRALRHSAGGLLAVACSDSFFRDQVKVSDLTLALSAVSTSPLFSVELSGYGGDDGEAISSQGEMTVQTSRVGVESMRERVLEIRNLVEALEYESRTLVSELLERGFILNDGPIPALECGVGDTVRLFQKTNNTAMRIGKVGVITSVEDEYYDIDDTYTVYKKDVELFKE